MRKSAAGLPTYWMPKSSTITKSKHDWFGGVDKETGGEAGLDKTSRGELAHKLLVG